MKTFVEGKGLGNGFLLWFYLCKVENRVSKHKGNEPSAALQKKRNYGDISDDEKNENNSSISSKTQEGKKGKSENNISVGKRRKTIHN